MKEWYPISNVSELDTPALVIYPDRVKENLRIVKSFINDVNRLRPHVKTNKCPDVVRMILDAGINKFKCATIAEAEMLATVNAGDVLLAYQPLGHKAQRFAELQKKFTATTFACLVDNQTSLRELAGIAKSENIKIRVFVDLNVGMNRTGVAPGKEAMAVVSDALSSEAMEFIGLHLYDGHLRDPDLAERKRKCDEAFKGVEDMKREVAGITGRDPAVVAGGTPTFPIHAKREDVEASPGTFIFWDKGYSSILTEQPYLFGALVATRVISVPTKNTLCLDLGHKSIASENVLEKRVYLLNGPELKPIGHSEEHMVFEAATAHHYRPGDVFYGVPHHICPTVALYDEAAVCRDNMIAETWPIVARKRKITV